MELIEILFPAFLIISVLIPMHTYLGIEIIRRQIIFTDLAVGQMASVGTAVSIILFHGDLSYIISAIFAVLTALLIALIIRNNEYQEAIVGIFYALGFALLFLVMSKSPSGMEHIKELTASDVLYVDYEDILTTAILYSVFFIILYYSKKSKNYDFVYFPIFALTIVHSVSLVGVLVVFTILVVPPLIGFLVNEKNEKRVYATGVLAGIVLSSFSIALAGKLDIPVGYTISAILSFTGISTALLKLNKSRKIKSQ